MTMDTGVTAVGMIVETIGAETTGVGISGAESKPTEKPNAVVNGSAAKIGPCVTATRTITATIVASATPREQSAENMGARTSLAGYSAAPRSVGQFDLPLGRSQGNLQPLFIQR
jgi:hypothetical protein